MFEISHYYDYRKFIKDFCKEQKKVNSSYSYRLFSKRAGISSSAHLPLILAGKRNLTPDTIEKYSKAMKLKSDDKKYFTALVNFNQTDEIKEKEVKLQALNKIRLKFKKENLEGKQIHSLYQKWYYVHIYELIQMEHFKEDGKWIAKKLGRRINAAQAINAIQTLLDSKHIFRDSDNHLRTNNQIVYSIDETENLLVRSFQLKMIEESLEHINDPIEEREFDSLTIALSSKQKEALKQKIKDFVIEVNNDFSVNNGEKELCQLNLQLFSFV